MPVPPVTPQAGLAYKIAVNGVAVVVVPANASGGYITNPYTAAGQGLGSAENLYVDPINTPGSTDGAGNNTTSVLYPGDSLPLIAGSTLPVRVNAASAGHSFTVVWWP